MERTVENCVTVVYLCEFVLVRVLVCVMVMVGKTVAVHDVTVVVTVM